MSKTLKGPSYTFGNLVNDLIISFNESYNSAIRIVIDFSVQKPFAALAAHMATIERLHL